jgi:hypothetical protein
MREVKRKRHVSEDKRTFSVFKWQHKGTPFEDAFRQAGWLPSSMPDVCLFDHDLNRQNTKRSRENLKCMADLGCMIALYPHSSLPEWWYGDLFEPDPLVSFRFQIAEAQDRAWKMYYPNYPSEICGWPWSDIQPFKPCSNPVNILFAPIHPPLNGTLRREAAVVNREVLLSLGRIKDRYNIRVRHLGEYRKQNLYKMPGIEFRRGQPDASTEDIEWADVVIAEQTFMYISVALGKPVVGIRQTECPNPNYSKHSKTDRWKSWWHLVRYPFSHDEGGLESLILQSAIYEPAEWKKINIGEKMNPELVVRTTEKYLGKFRKRKKR